MYITKTGVKKMPFYSLITEDAFSKFSKYAKKHKMKKRVLFEKLINDNIKEVN